MSLSDHIINITEGNAKMYGKIPRDEYGHEITTEFERGAERRQKIRDKGIGRTITGERNMTTDIEAPQAIETDVDLLAEARTYITLRQELKERGERLAKALQNQRLSGKTLVIGVDDSFYELSRTYSPNSAELPLRVVPVELLKS